MGRRPKEIDQKQFENLCGLQCTYDEICSWFDVTDKTLNSWCKRTYGKNFSEVFNEKRGRGKISLRRTQWELAKKNASMAIFLGKQYLGQSDQGGVITEKDIRQEDALSASLKKIAEGLDSDD
nr:MAG TPA: putative terminase small subunit [Caudoviricetes sp.]DAT66689.1 MAG TPA: putative terminase small subunit [Caudoviricetes sp.]